MGNYILYGKDEEGRNSEQRKEVTIDKKKKTWRRKVDCEESLDALMDDPNLPGIESQFMDANKRNIRVLKKLPFHAKKMVTFPVCEISGTP